MRLFGFEIRRAAAPQTRFLGDLVKVDLAPGDVCVLMARRRLETGEAAQFSELWRAAVGDDVTLVVLDDGLKLGVLSPPQAAAVYERLEDAESVERAVA
jgi:hypothetical protein